MSESESGYQRAKNILPFLEGELRDALAELARAQERVDGLSQAIDGLKLVVRSGPIGVQEAIAVEPPEERESSPSAPYPRGTPAVVRVVVEAGRPMSRRQVLQALEERGWPPKSKNPLNAVGVYLRRAAEAGDLVEVGRRIYAPPSESAPE